MTTLIRCYYCKKFLGQIFAGNLVHTTIFVCPDCDQMIASILFSAEAIHKTFNTHRDGTEALLRKLKMFTDRNRSIIDQLNKTPPKIN